MLDCISRVIQVLLAVAVLRCATNWQRVIAAARRDKPYCCRSNVRSTAASAAALIPDYCHPQMTSCSCAADASERSVFRSFERLLERAVNTRRRHKKLLPECDRQLCKRKAKLLWNDWFRFFPGNSTTCCNAIGSKEVRAPSKSMVLSGLRTLAAALRVLRWPHLHYDCIYSRPQLYLRLLHLERSPDTDDGLFDVFCVVRCSSLQLSGDLDATDVSQEACVRSVNETLRRTGFDPPFRNTCELVATTCAYLRVLSRFVRCCRNIFASL